ncbi:hypothetical protein BKA70DRAFT_1449695 [Coprinopsis sp. MPI-PUGE-AT-0042]|nr:hypothetical protein BKA70DRAFT_1449695 [Coprinopsis sp. MPI-PUGE-AT-0042]
MSTTAPTTTTATTTTTAMMRATKATTGTTGTATIGPGTTTAGRTRAGKMRAVDACSNDDDDDDHYVDVAIPTSTLPADVAGHLEVPMPPASPPPHRQPPCMRHVAAHTRLVPADAIGCTQATSLLTHPASLPHMRPAQADASSHARATSLLTHPSSKLRHRLRTGHVTSHTPRLAASCAPSNPTPAAAHAPRRYQCSAAHLRVRSHAVS